MVTCPVSRGRVFLHRSAHASEALKPKSRESPVARRGFLGNRSEKSFSPTRRRFAIDTADNVGSVSCHGSSNDWGETGGTPTSKESEIRVRMGKPRLTQRVDQNAANGALSNTCAENKGLKLAPQVGFEPTTLRLTAECSTVELLRSKETSHQTRRSRQFPEPLQPRLARPVDLEPDALR